MYFLDKNFFFSKASMDLENMSTSVAILELIEEITNAIDDCKSTVGAVLT